MSKIITLEITETEALILSLFLNKEIERQEKEYQKNKEDESFMKEEALSEIKDLKRLLNKIYE
jgi:hypothetical protein